MEDHKEILDHWRDHFEWRFVEANYPKCSILDYGCGYGYSDIWLARNGFTVTGYDPNATRVGIAQALMAQEDSAVISALRFTTGRDWESQTFDLVWCSHVLEHVPFSGWERVLGDFGVGASVLVSVPLKYAFDMPEHLHHWSDENEFLRDLKEYSGGDWSVWVDEANRVIKGTLS